MTTQTAIISSDNLSTSGMNMTSGNAILFSEMTPQQEFAERFHHWYDTHHIPIRMACNGFISARRYRRTDREGYLAVYELLDDTVLDSGPYNLIKNKPSDETSWMLKNVTGFTRYLATQTSTKRQGSPTDAVDAPILYSVSFNVPEAAAVDFEAWYDQEHIPLLMECPDWHMVRRFRVVSGAPEIYTHMALHYLGDISALQSPAREKARRTSWRDRLAANAWFKPNYTVFEAHGPRQVGIG
ncbi:hypothetical protein [Bradyrhizobium sp. RDM4]|uniref:hypothetical protein n=1 Tax=Bradyrhizobium sp. RDM4 TaxID=3378765 RepID=UPI0038FC3186